MRCKKRHAASCAFLLLCCYTTNLTYPSFGTAQEQAIPRGVHAIPNVGKSTSASIYQKQYAVIVGIDQYPLANIKFPNLNGAVSDANLVAAALEKMGFDDVVTLRNERATKARIIETLGDEIGMKATPNDLIVFFFAGHGDTRGQEGEQMGFILPSDYDPKKHLTSSISMSTLRDVSRQIQAKHILYVMDSCFSGGILQSRASVSNVPLEGAWRYAQGLLERTAHIVITAGGQSDFANEEGGRGLFTKVMLEGLSGAADPGKRGFITASGLALYIQEHLPELLPPGVKQQPQYGRLLGEGDVVLAALRAPSLNREKANEEDLKAKIDQGYSEKTRQLQTEFDRLLETANAAQKKKLEEEYRLKQTKERAEYEKQLAVVNERIALERRMSGEKLQKEVSEQRKQLEQEFLERQALEQRRAKEEFEKLSIQEKLKLTREFEERQLRERADYERQAKLEREQIEADRRRTRDELDSALQERRKAEEFKRQIEENAQMPQKQKEKRGFFSPSF